MDVLSIAFGIHPSQLLILKRHYILRSTYFPESNIFRAASAEVDHLEPVAACSLCSFRLGAPDRRSTAGSVFRFAGSLRQVCKREDWTYGSCGAVGGDVVLEAEQQSPGWVALSTAKESTSFEITLKWARPGSRLFPFRFARQLGKNRKRDKSRFSEGPQNCLALGD